MLLLLFPPLFQALNPFLLSYLIAGLWGVADAIWQTQTSSMVGVVFQDRQESAFACWRLWQQLGFVLSFAASPSVCTNVGLWIGLAVLAVSTAGLGVVEIKRRKKITEEERRVGEEEGGRGVYEAGEVDESEEGL